MALVEKILEELSKPTLMYKGVRVNLLGLPTFKKYPDGSIRTTLWRLHKQCLIEKDLAGWYITPAGKNYMKRKVDSLLNFDFKFSKEAPKNLIVMYDIPENKKAEREWLRWHLKKFNYEIIQRSVWVGPSPLPKEFMDYIKKIKLKGTIKTFKLAKPYSFYKNR
jgi:DNA-binding transcriptional regulator PaaX